MNKTTKLKQMILKTKTQKHKHTPPKPNKKKKKNTKKQKKKKKKKKKNHGKMVIKLLFNERIYGIYILVSKLTSKE
jgi:hypothetical protein